MKYVIIAGIIILIGFIVALHFIPIGIEPLSEVYFENHTSLPIRMLANDTRFYNFTVHNLEYRDMQYSYNISAEYMNLTQQFDFGTFSLMNNETMSFNETLHFGHNFDRAKVQVLVTKDTNESIDIDFWVDQIVPIKIIIEKNDTNSTK